MREIIKFRAIISHRTIILFTLEDLVRPYLSFSIRELVIPWLRLGNKPDRYIGLTDKNGKEIYEGDVVEVDPECIECSDKGLIYWDENRAAFRMSFPDGDIWDIQWDIESSEVIGNRYENPELLEVQK